MGYTKRYTEFLRNYSTHMGTQPFSRQAKVLWNAGLYFLSPKKEIVRNKPITVQIEPTSACNLRCTMCIRETLPLGTMTFENYKKILDQLDTVMKIHLQGQGEPFFQKDIIKMVKYAKSRGIMVNMNTNATILNEKKCRELARAGLYELAISIDSTGKELFEKIRVNAKFDVVVNNIKLMTRIKKELKANMIVSLAVTILKDNKDEVLDFVPFAKELGVDKINFQIVQEKETYLENYGDFKDNDHLIGKDLRKNMYKKMEEVVKKGKELGIDIWFDEPFNNCVWPWRGMYVDWRGYATPCCTILDTNQPKIGKILDVNFMEKIWNGPVYRGFRKSTLLGIPPKACEGCEQFPTKKN
jgi:MoaA/NifB/PqqE/SkfB family radical SAM enzyme